MPCTSRASLHETVRLQSLYFPTKSTDDFVLFTVIRKRVPDCRRYANTGWSMKTIAVATGRGGQMGAVAPPPATLSRLGPEIIANPLRNDSAKGGG